MSRVERGTQRITQRAWDTSGKMMIMEARKINDKIAIASRRLLARGGPEIKYRRGRKKNRGK